MGAGERIEIDVLPVVPIPPNFNPVWRLLDLNGVPRCGGFATGLAECVLDGNGNTYRLEVADGNTNATGTYTAHVQRLNAAVACEHIALPDATTVTADIGPSNDSDLFQFGFDLAAPQNVSVSVQKGAPAGLNFNPVWRLLDATGTQKCGGFHSTGLVDCALDAAGDPYRVEVFDSNRNDTGTYSVFVQR